MNISREEGLSLLHKMKDESSEVVGGFETPGLTSVWKFRGALDIGSDDTVISICGSGFETALGLFGVQFSYEDPREAPDRLKSWAAVHFESVLILECPAVWRLGLYEFKANPPS